MGDNLETRARQQCALDLASLVPPPPNLEAAIDRYWLVVAIEIAGGLLATTGVIMPVDLEQRIREYEKLFPRR